jgi:cephalosporin hydroxylase
MNSNDTNLAFEDECRKEILALGADVDLQRDALNLAIRAAKFRYVFHFEWMGRTIIQYPQDIVAMQELIWNVKPDLIIETGIAHGGSLIFSASMLAMLDLCDAIEAKRSIDPSNSGRKVLGIDIEIRDQNRKAIKSHPLSSRIQMIEASSIGKDTITEVQTIAKNYQRILVCLDSNHTHEHVLSELDAYAPLVSEGSYCVVFDTVVEDLPKDYFKDRPWGPGNSPKTAVNEFLKKHPEFEIDQDVHSKLLITVAPSGFLRRKVG